MEKMVKFSSIFLKTYTGRRVLVTGHSGFKGSWLCLWLRELGAQVAGFSKYLPSEPCHFGVLQLKKKLKHYEGDICQIAQLKKVFDEFRPEMVFHLAAQPLVRESYNSPKKTFDTNLGGTINLLECVRQTPGVRVAVLITSDKCYENVGWDWGYREADRLGGHDPYSASKACAEVAFKAYFESFFKGDHAAFIATTRAGNVIGGGDWAEDRIIPDCVRAWSQGKSPLIRSPEATRPWQHVLEPLSGYLWLGALLWQRPSGLRGESFNFGPASEVVQPVRELANLFLKYWGKGTWKQTASLEEKKEAKLLKLSCDKALHRLGWKSVLTFEETVALTAQWYKYYYQKLKNKDFEKLALKQIETYVAKAKDQHLAWAMSNGGA